MDVRKLGTLRHRQKNAKSCPAFSVAFDSDASVHRLDKTPTSRKSQVQAPCRRPVVVSTSRARGEPDGTRERVRSQRPFYSASMSFPRPYHHHQCGSASPASPSGSISGSKMLQPLPHDTIRENSFSSWLKVSYSPLWIAVDPPTALALWAKRRSSGFPPMRKTMGGGQDF